MTIRLSLRQAAQVGIVAAALAIGVLALCLVTGSGCAGVPTKLDSTFYTLTNIPMATVRNITNVVNVTNWVEHPVAIIQTNTVTLTNLQQQVEVHQVTLTNIVQVQVPVVSRETNVIPAGTITNVPQLLAPNGTAVAGQGLVSGVAGIFGWGGLASTVMTGLFGWYQRSRNARLIAAATGATSAQQVAEQASGALVQNIETFLNVLQQTPQGAQLTPLIKNYLMAHQTETGTIQTVSKLIEQYVDNNAAQQSAAEILKALSVLGAPQPATAKA